MPRASDANESRGTLAWLTKDRRRVLKSLAREELRDETVEKYHAMP